VWEEIVYIKLLSWYGVRLRFALEIISWIVLLIFWIKGVLLGHVYQWEEVSRLLQEKQLGDVNMEGYIEWK